jgi:hypothetical protein
MSDSNAFRLIAILPDGIHWLKTDPSPFQLRRAPCKVFHSVFSYPTLLRREKRTGTLLQISII